MYHTNHHTNVITAIWLLGRCNWYTNIMFKGVKFHNINTKNTVWDMTHQKV